MSKVKKDPIVKTKTMKRSRSWQETALYITTILLAIYTVFRIISSANYMVSYMSAYEMEATSNITILLSYVVGQALPYILFTVLFFLYARMHKNIRLLKESHGVDVSFQENADANSKEDDKKEQSFESAELPKAEDEVENKAEEIMKEENNSSNEKEGSGRLTLLPDEE